MSGWLVVIETKRLGRGGDLREVYAVNEPLQPLALATVVKAARVLDERVIGWAPISDEFLKVFDVPEGECRRVQAVS